MFSRHPLGCSAILDWIAAAWIVVFLAWLLVGCAHHESTLQRMNREVQDCILSGGTAHAGPDNTIECAY